MWWKYPMKPVRINTKALEKIALEKYLMEVKLDGHRAILVVDGGKKRLLTRQKSPIVIPASLQAQLDRMKLEEGTVLDGEIWNPLKRGGWTADGGEPSVLSFWDCLREGLQDIGAKPMSERREALARVIGKGDESVRIVRQEEASASRVREIFEESLAVRKENQSRSGFVHGVVLKLKGSPRRDHATKTQEHSDWLKVVFDGMSGWA